MITTEEKLLIDDILESYEIFGGVNLFLEHNVGNSDLVLVTEFGYEDEDVIQDTDYDTIRQDTDDIDFTLEVFQYLLDAHGHYAEVILG